MLLVLILRTWQALTCSEGLACARPRAFKSVRAKDQLIICKAIAEFFGVVLMCDGVDVGKPKELRILGPVEEVVLVWVVWIMVAEVVGADGWIIDGGHHVVDSSRRGGGNSKGLTG